MFLPENKTERTLVGNLINPFGRLARPAVGGEVSMDRRRFPTFEFHKVLESERCLLRNDRPLQNLVNFNKGSMKMEQTLGRMVENPPGSE